MDSWDCDGAAGCTRSLPRLPLPEDPWANLLYPPLPHLSSSSAGDPSRVELPGFGKGGKQCLSSKILRWLSLVEGQVNTSEANQQKMRHCWEKSGLLAAWSGDAQREAVREAVRLFR